MPTYRKYVKVLSVQDVCGISTPLKIVWEDGKTFDIDRVVYMCRAASTKAGGTGLRYTIKICGKERYLYYVESENRWFVEAQY